MRCLWQIVCLGWPGNARVSLDNLDETTREKEVWAFLLRPWRKWRGCGNNNNNNNKKKNKIIIITQYSTKTLECNACILHRLDAVYRRNNSDPSYYLADCLWVLSLPPFLSGLVSLLFRMKVTEGITEASAWSTVSSQTLNEPFALTRLLTGVCLQHNWFAFIYYRWWILHLEGFHWWVCMY